MGKVKSINDITVILHSMDIKTLHTSFKNKKVFITGHTGFKGGWLALWLTHLGAQVYGYALQSPFIPALHKTLQLENMIHNEEGDVKDGKKLLNSISTFRPDIIYHLAAQSLVRESYVSPLETVETNVMGTINVLEAVRVSGIRTSAVIVTSDKCYQNKEWLHGYRENDPMGGHDPYSASKGATEILVDSWRKSFFNPAMVAEHGVHIATVRAGNVIGGGDWSKDRIVPDCIRALIAHQVITVRKPEATRPWQHVLEPLSGYLLLGSKLMSTTDGRFCQAFNFGPSVSSNRNVGDLVGKIVHYWGEGSWAKVPPEVDYHESSLLHLSIDKVYHQLSWAPQWNFDETVLKTVEWYKVWRQDPDTIRDFTLNQIQSYEQGSDSNVKQTEHELITIAD